MDDLDFLTECMLASQRRKQAAMIEVDRGLISMRICDTIYEGKNIQECITQLKNTFAEMHLKCTINKP